MFNSNKIKNKKVPKSNVCIVDTKCTTLRWVNKKTYKAFVALAKYLRELQIVHIEDSGSLGLNFNKKILFYICSNNILLIYEISNFI